MSRERPIAITFIGDCHILVAVLLLLSLFPFMKRFGLNVLLPDFLSATALTEALIKILIAALILIISYGYLKLKKWGYWLIVSINLCSLAAWFIANLQGKRQFSPDNPMAAMIGLIFIIPTIKYFYKKAAEE